MNHPHTRGVSYDPIVIKEEYAGPASPWFKYVVFQVGSMNPEGGKREVMRLAAIKRYTEIPDKLVHLIYSYMAPLKH
jgi:hypothetical protein